jgi:hypothetical protein
MARGNSFLSKVLKGAEWRQIQDYLSPAILDVLKPAELRKQTWALAKPWVKRSYWKTEKAQVLDHVDRVLFARFKPSEHDDSNANQNRAQQLLKLYFFQIMCQDSAILDLRYQAFSSQGSAMNWEPSPLYMEWDPDFIAPLRDIYAGFYGDNTSAFDDGLAALNLLPARDIFIQHFGMGDQRTTEFKLSHFHDTFHQTFTRCHEHGVQLHGNFLGLGLMLACLYEHLETIGVACDVRQAYEQVSTLELV